MLKRFNPELQNVNDDLSGPDHNNAWFSLGRLKMREWKMRYGQKCKDGKCRSRKCSSSLAVWKAGSWL